jgi:ribonuclease-3
MSDDPVSAMASELEELERALDYRFRDPGLLERALQHASYAHDVEGAQSNERLEFLGDAVIGLVVAHLLFEAHGDWEEGDLTRGLHRLVDKSGLAALARDLQLGEHLRLGRTERRSQGQTKSSILADALEAIFGAIYLDGGLEPIMRLARRSFAPAFEPGAPRVGRDPKTELQESVMAEVGEFPSYDLVSDSEQDDDEERFTARVRVRDEVWGEGVGRTKRSAERAAAEQALRRGAGHVD